MTQLYQQYAPIKKYQDDRLKSAMLLHTDTKLWDFCRNAEYTRKRNIERWNYNGYQLMISPMYATIYKLKQNEL